MEKRRSDQDQPLDSVRLEAERSRKGWLKIFLGAKGQKTCIYKSQFSVCSMMRKWRGDKNCGSKNFIP
jgi:hypothetical protein